MFVSLLPLHLHVLRAEREIDAQIIYVVIVVAGNSLSIFDFDHFLGDEGRGKIGEEQ